MHKLTSMPATHKSARHRGVSMLPGAAVAVALLVATAAASSTGLRSAAAESEPRTPVGTWEQVVHHPSPPVDHATHRSRISFHADRTVTDSSPHGVALGRWRWVDSGTFEFVIDEHQYVLPGATPLADGDHVHKQGPDIALIVIPHCTATFLDTDRWSGTCTAGLFTPDGVRIRTVSGNTIEGNRLQFPADY